MLPKLPKKNQLRSAAILMVRSIYSPFFILYMYTVFKPFCNTTPSSEVTTGAVTKFLLILFVLQRQFENWGTARRYRSTKYILLSICQDWIWSCQERLCTSKPMLWWLIRESVWHCYCLFIARWRNLFNFCTMIFCACCGRATVVHHLVILDQCFLYF